MHQLFKQHEQQMAITYILTPLKYIHYEKVFVITVLAIASFSSSNAQVTWNIRVGGGLIESFGYWDDYYWGDYYWGDYVGGNEGAFVLALESNIPFKRGKAFCFSPSVIGAIGGESQEFIFPLLVGYKLKLSQNSLLIPKVGLNVGGSYMVRPMELWGHPLRLVLNTSILSWGLMGGNVIEDYGSSYLFTLGYKF